MKPDRETSSAKGSGPEDSDLGLDASWSPVVYGELRRMANALLTHERTGHTLEPTALAHEVWLRLSKSRNAGSLDHSAFLRLAAQAMRRILTEHARRRATAKRGGLRRQTTLSGQAIPVDPHDFILDLDDALQVLKVVDSELVEVVLLRFYAGCDVDEIAAVLGISARTVKRRWRFARAWLQRYMVDTVEGEE